MATIPVLEREIDQRIFRLKKLNEQDDFTEGDQNEITTLREELNDKQNQLEQRRYLASLEADSVKADEPDLAKAKREFSVRKAILSQIPTWKGDAGLELEVSQEISGRSKQANEDGSVWCPLEQQRAITNTTPSGGAGSNIIGTDHLGSQFIPLLRSSRIASLLPMLRLSASNLLRIPRQKSGVFGKALGETASLTNEDAEFEVVTAGPPKRVGILASYSYQQMLMSDPSVESLVVSDLNERMQRVVDKLILYGQNDTITAGQTNTGYGTHPFTLKQWTDRIGELAVHWEGITHDVPFTTPVTATAQTTDGLTLKIEDITKLKNEIDKEDIPMDGRVFVTSPMLYNKLSDTLEFSSSGSMPIARNGTIRGMPTVLSTAVVHNRSKGTGRTLSDLIYAHWPSFGFVTFDAVQILTNPYGDADFKAGRISVRAQCYHDTFKRYDSSSICSWYGQCVTA